MAFFNGKPVHVVIRRFENEYSRSVIVFGSVADTKEVPFEYFKIKHFFVLYLTNCFCYLFPGTEIVWEKNARNSNLY